MQNRYVGDIGDFGKYGLLRALTSEGRGTVLPLSIAWYMYPDEIGGGDGRLIGYLRESDRNNFRFRNCDPPLYDSLGRIVRIGDRNVVAIRHSGLLPSTTTYYEVSLSYPYHMRKPDRLDRRNKWLHDSLSKTANSDLVFIDPDNGLSLTAKRWLKKGPKYVFMDDLMCFYNRGQSLVIYHHLSRQCKADQQIKLLSGALQECLSLTQQPWVLRYHRGTARAYFILAQENHRENIETRINLFLASPWGMHFSRVQ